MPPEEPSADQWTVLELGTDRPTMERKITSANDEITRPSYPASSPAGHANKVVVMPNPHSADTLLPGTNDIETNVTGLHVARSFHRLSDAFDETSALNSSSLNNPKNGLIPEVIHYS